MEEAKHIHAANLPFAGMPILLKNISQSLQGEKLTSGSKLLKAAIAKRDSNFVKKIRKAGFQVIEHTNTPEFGLKKGNTGKGQLSLSRDSDNSSDDSWHIAFPTGKHDFFFLNSWNDTLGANG